MTSPTSERLEALLAQALEAFDQGGEGALEEFLGGHAAERTSLLRAIDRCRQMGLVGDAGPARDFPDRLGEFRLVRRIGGGGMGVVYEAEQTSLGRRVALKVIRPELLYFEGARERFRREIEAVARLSHPAVVPVLASGEQDGVPYYVMELLAGRTAQEITVALAGQDPARLDGSCLRPLLAHSEADATDPLRGPWWQVCTRLIHAVGLGVRHAHLRGIVHRDIKPSNVMITPHGTAVLLDFGVASITGGQEFTRTGNTPGSPAFMSPEQLRGDAVDERTDVYSLGATLWHLLALAPAFRGLDDLQRIRDGDLPSLRARNREVPRELELVLRTAMDRDRERRYADMESFTNDLLAVVARRPIQARRLGLGLRLLRWSQRHRAAATLAGTTLLAAATLPALFAWRERGINQQLAAAKVLAEGSLEQTLAALDTVLLRLGNDQLRGVPLAEAVAVESLRDATRMYRQLVPQHPEHARLRQQAGRALDSLAAALQRQGRLDEAIATAHEAVELLGGGRDGTPALRDGRAYAAMNLAGMLIATGRPEQAVQFADLAEQDFAAVGALPRWRVSSLRGRSAVATLRTSLPPAAGDAAQVEAGLRASLELSRQWLQLAPADREAMANEILRLDSLATFLSQHGQRQAAEALLRAAEQKARALPADATSWPPQPLVLSDVLETLGNLQLDQKDLESPKTLRECLRLREQIAGQFPFNVEIRCKLGGAAHNLGLVMYHQARDLEALEQFTRARDLQRSCLHENPRDRTALEYLRKSLIYVGNCQRQLERREDVAATAGELAQLDQDRLAQRAGAFLLLRAIEMLAKEKADGAADLEQQYARRALDMLLRAERLGWGSRSRLDEPVYAPLLRFPEFAALKQRVAQRLSAGK